MVLADLNEVAGRTAAASLGDRRIVWEKVDANDGQSHRGEVVTTTARSLSIGAQLLGEKKIEQKGVLAPEACMGPTDFFEKLRDGGGVTLTEEKRTKSVLIR